MYDHEQKKANALRVKALLKRFGFKGSISCAQHKRLTVVLRSGPVDLMALVNESISSTPNEYRQADRTRTEMSLHRGWIDEFFSDAVRDILTELMKAMEEGNWETGSHQFDTYNFGWISCIDIGEWDKPYTPLVTVKA